MLGKDGCDSCIKNSGVSGPMSSRCGNLGVKDMVAQFGGLPVQNLYNKLKNVGGPPSQVFDVVGISSEEKYALFTI